MKQPLSPDQCPECFYSNKRHAQFKAIHSPTCSQIDLESAKCHLKYYKAQESLTWNKVNLWRDIGQRWEAKYRTVKHENNQLRKKLKP